MVMAATPFLHNINLKFTQSTFAIHFPPTIKPINYYSNHHFLKTIPKFNHTPPKFCTICCSFDKKPQKGITHLANKETQLQVFTQTISRFVEHALQKPVITAVLLGLLLFYDPNSAFAASGGRMGGSSFSSSRSSMSSSSRSYSTPRMGSGRSFSSAPYFGPSAFGGGGFYVGPAVGFGSSFVFILAGFAAFVLVSGFLSDRSGDGLLTATEKTSVLKLQVGLLGMARSLQKDLNRIAEIADTSTPVGLSYILSETTLALLRHPDFCISGYSFDIMAGSVLISGFGFGVPNLDYTLIEALLFEGVDVKRSMEEGEKRFNQLSIEERGKFDEETLVNVNNIRKQSATSKRPNGFSNEYIVITILVAAEGVHKLPSINGSGDLKEALQKLGSIPSSRILAVEVLWTPQNEGDTLSERELLEDYSLLRPL